MRKEEEEEKDVSNSVRAQNGIYNDSSN